MLQTQEVCREDINENSLNRRKAGCVICASLTKAERGVGAGFHVPGDDTIENLQIPFVKNKWEDEWECSEQMELNHKDFFSSSTIMRRCAFKNELQDRSLYNELLMTRKYGLRLYDLLHYSVISTNPCHYLNACNAMKICLSFPYCQSLLHYYAVQFFLSLSLLCKHMDFCRSFRWNICTYTHHQPPITSVIISYQHNHSSTLKSVTKTFQLKVQLFVIVFFYCALSQWETKMSR